MYEFLPAEPSEMNMVLQLNYVYYNIIFIYCASNIG